MLRVKRNEINWPTSLFLISTLVLFLTVVPVYLWHNSLDLFQIGLFLFFFFGTGMSITVGYHRLFSHRAFEARWPVRLFTLLFGAAAFESSCLDWAADHRRHHKHADQELDPHDITKGFFHAHMGWLLRKMNPPSSHATVPDLQQDKWIAWQHRFYIPIAFVMGLGLPAFLGWLWGGPSAALGSLLISGIARLVIVQHMTFFINSLCHCVGRQPYSTQFTARDSGIMAVFTFGEGYHNFHHEFQHDYRNGVKAWQYDPTKWAIWALQKLGLTRNLRRVPDEKILLAEIREKQRRLQARLNASPTTLSEPLHHFLHNAQDRLKQASANWELRQAEYRQALRTKMEASREKIAELQTEFHASAERLRAAIKEWQEAYQRVQAQFRAMPC